MPTENLESLAEERARLARERAALDAQISELDRAITTAARVATSDAPVQKLQPDAPAGVVDVTADRKRTPVRQLALDALDDFGCMLYSREVANYVRTMYGRDVPPARFGALGKDELASFTSARPRPVYLAHALTHDRGQAIKRLWGRSDWPLHDRVVAPTTGRVQHLLATLRFCQLAAERADTASDPTMLQILAADHAADLPGVKVRRGDFELHAWADVAATVLAEVAPRDEELRREAAERLSLLPPDEQLFGAPDRALFAVPAPPPAEQASS